MSPVEPVSVPTSLSETRGSRADCGDKGVPGATWPESVLNKIDKQQRQYGGICFFLIFEPQLLQSH